jgi:hypothetical protein
LKQHGGPRYPNILVLRGDALPADALLESAVERWEIWGGGEVESRRS